MKYTNYTKNAFFTSVNNGMSIATAAKNHKISPQTAYNWAATKRTTKARTAIATQSPATIAKAVNYDELYKFVGKLVLQQNNITI